ncbi:hypothetical protein Hanom_Chr17g01582671 [Helianthus anomalus]
MLLTIDKEKSYYLLTWYRDVNSLDSLKILHYRLLNNNKLIQIHLSTIMVLFHSKSKP